MTSPDDIAALAEIEQFAEHFMTAEPGHDFEHVRRVRNWAVRLARGEGSSDLAAVQAAALLHDIGLPEAQPRCRHGEIGAEKARAFLTSQGHFPAPVIDAIGEAIRFHCTNRGGKGALLDIVRDADMMDMFGAMGIVRCVKFVAHKPDYAPEHIKGATWGMSARDFDERFDSGVGVGETLMDFLNFHISCYDNLATDTARRLAEPLVRYIQGFVRQCASEIETNREPHSSPST